jgi:hypothetical protein
MSVKQGKPYRIVNKQADLALESFPEDHNSILGEHIDPKRVKNQTVRIACRVTR